MDLGVAARLDQILADPAAVVDREEDVLPDRALEQGRFLGHQGDVLAVSADVEVGDVDVVDENLAVLGLVESTCSLS